MKKNDLDKIRFAYETRAISVREIAQIHKVSPSTVYSWAKKNGWQSPHFSEQAKQERPSGTPVHMEPSGSLSERLMKAFSVQIEEMEARMQDPQTTLTEGDARTLNTLTRTFEKLHAMELDQAHDDSGRSLESLREELAKRLKRLRENQ